MNRNITRKVRIALGTAAVSIAMGASASEGAAPLACELLTTLRIPDVRVVRATEILPEPEWLAPLPTENDRFRAPVRKPFCRVEGTIEDEIGFELWLPDARDWNGRMLGTGNGGFAGFFRYETLARGVNRGFAGVSTDTGHKITEVNWPLGHPRRLENLGHRGQHLTAVNAKKIIAAHYGRPPHHSYFIGCSGGGMQAMNEVQRYPADYDGIIAGAHGTSIVGISARWLASALIAQYRPEASLSPEEWRRIAEAAIQACDANDGVRDGILNEPRKCRFDIAKTPGLSPEKIAAARELLGPVRGRDGIVLFPAFDPGVAFSPIASPGRAGEVFALWGYGDPNWDFRQFDAARDVPLVEAAVPGSSFTNPNLEAFYRRGGKLISWHGWTDQIVPVQSTIDYYESVERFMGREKTREFYRMYLAPGVDHCRGGAGPDSFGVSYDEPPIVDAEHDMLTAIVEWVESGKAPRRLIASKVVDGKVTMTRPLCPYPQVVKYKGGGDPNDAANFTCADP
ncbi:MAG TPA: tannase/feruloyl esterase family alpha/beta hydrolase [Steroidobacteraceae bacterium]